MLKVDHLSKSFRESQAVKDLSFEVKSGEVLGLIGPNGAGKTTTLRVLAGALRPDQGTISIGGRDIQRDPVEAKRQLAYLPDQPPFFPSLNCWDHVRLIAKIYGIKDFEPLALQLFDRFELTSKKNDLPAVLSKGMNQRLGLICAFVRAPKLILFDEPMTGLDPKGIRTLNDLIKESSSSGAAVVLSSHLLSILEEVCTKVLVMSSGISRMYGTLSDVRAKSETLASDSSLEEVFFHATKNEDVA